MPVRSVLPSGTSTKKPIPEGENPLQAHGHDLVDDEIRLIEDAGSALDGPREAHPKGPYQKVGAHDQSNPFRCGKGIGGSRAHAVCEAGRPLGLTHIRRRAPDFVDRMSGELGLRGLREHPRTGE
jgi:hypothetical protein